MSIRHSFVFCLIALAGGLPGCRGGRGALEVSIEKLGDAFQKTPQGLPHLKGRRVVVSGGEVDRLQADHVSVVGKKDGRYGVRLLCYYTPEKRAAIEKAWRGQEVTVSGLLAPSQVGGAEVLIRLDGCEFTLGEPPDEANRVPATKGPGEIEAERDIKDGKLRLRERLRGKPPPWVGKYSHLLKDKCGVELVVLPEAGPIKGLHPDDREYNDVMTAEIEKRHGAGIVEKLRKLAGSGPPP